MKVTLLNSRQAIVGFRTSTQPTQLLPFDRLIPEQLEQNAITVLPIELEHLSGVIDLPFHHRDPFDRLIIAQSLAEQLPVITNDAAFRRYSVQLIW